MTPSRLRFLLPLALGVSMPTLAQEIVAPPTPLADALAGQVRILAADPRDVRALIAAGELSVRLADPAAALAFFGRAQSLEPNDPRVAAGKAGALVLLERPGEALRLYAQAERAGLSMRPYLAERGLAYDLVGQPGYAQQDYRAALAMTRDDETVRRLALSLGVSGKRDEAMALLDPLLRKSDRAAWRARACILAMGGDSTGGERIAASMMPGGGALAPFLRRLQWLSLADRAFAVHFGEITPSLARQNDARLAPAVAMLPPDPAPLPVVSPLASGNIRARAADRRSRRDRRSSPAIDIAALTPTSAPEPLPLPPRSQVPSSALAMLTPSRVPMRMPMPMPVPTPTPFGPLITSATAGMTIFTPPKRTVPPQRFTADPRTPTPKPTPPPVAVAARTTPLSGWAATADAAPIRIVPMPAPVPAPVVAKPAPVPIAASPEPAPVATQPELTPDPVEVVAVEPARAEPVVVQSLPPPPPPPPAPPPRVSAIDSIVGGIAVPAEELEVRRTLPRVVATIPKSEPRKVKPEVARPDPKKAKPDPAKVEPARWWAQVAGGANATDLGKDWKRLSATSAAAFRGKGAWTTPLRATNRLLAGPFKSQAEAMTFVNLLAKDGASAFAWQSEAGQVVTKLVIK